MALTCHSEYGKIHSLLLKSVNDAFFNETHVSENCKKLNYLAMPYMDHALKEYQYFEAIIKSTISSVTYLPFDRSVNMDSIYCRDAAIATNAGMLLCNMGKEERKKEPSALRKALEDNDIKILGEITSPGSVEGGDVAWLGEHILAVGLTYRTNKEGIRQLTELITPLGVEVITVSMPHYKGQKDVFHLMSILSPIDKNVAVVYSPLMPIDFRNYLLNNDFLLIDVPDDEFDSMGCNVLALAPRTCVMVDGNPKTKSKLESEGFEVLVYEGNEISLKGGGGPTCLTRPIQRIV